MDAENGVAGRLLPRSYALTNANAKDLSQSLYRLFQERRANMQPNQPGAEPEPRFEAEDNNNMLLVSATPAQYEIIDKLIEQMETDAADRCVQVKMFALKQAPRRIFSRPCWRHSPPGPASRRLTARECPVPRSAWITMRGRTCW